MDPLAVLAYGAEQAPPLIGTRHMSNQLDNPVDDFAAVTPGWPVILEGDLHRMPQQEFYGPDVVPGSCNPIIRTEQQKDV